MNTGQTNSNIFTLIKQQWGESMLALSRKLEKTRVKYINIRMQRL